MQSIPNSPDILTLNVKFRVNLDSPIPTIVALNNSVGENLSACQYVFKLTNPYGIDFYEGSFEAPDKTGIWNQFSIPARIPSVGGHIPWNGEWIMEVQVKDSTGTIYKDTLSRVICRPTGNQDKEGNNYGVATVNAVVHCDKAKLYFEDKTNYSYDGKIGDVVTNTVKLLYPPDSTNIQPEPFVAEDIAHALIPLYFNGEAHRLVVDSVIDYDNNSGIIVRIKYRYNETFSVRCGADLCDLACIIERYSKRIEDGGCSVEERHIFQNLIAKATQALMGIIQPLCGIDVERLICEAKALATDDCGCGSKNIDGLNKGMLYSTCSAPANLVAQWNAETGMVVVNWDRIQGGVDKLTIPELNFKRNNVFPPIAIPTNPNVLMNIRVNRTCEDGVMTVSTLVFQSIFNNEGLPLLIIEHPQTQKVNIGSTVTLRVRATGHQPFSYQWYKNGVDIPGATSMDLVLEDTQQSDSASYYARVTDNDGTTADSNPAVLTVNKPLVIIEHPQTQLVNLGDGATFSVLADGDNPLTYQWRKGNVNIPGATSSSYSIPVTGLADAGQYSVRVRDNDGEELISNYAALQINQLVTITQHPASQGVNTGQSVNLTVRATGDNPLSYQWFKNGVEIDGATGRDLVLTNASLATAGVYSVLVTDVNGDTAQSNGATVTVNQLVIITLQPVSQNKQQGEDVTFVVTATGDNPLTYQWRKNGVDIPGANGSSYTINNLGVGDAANYTVYVQDVNGDSAISAAAALTVNKPVIIVTHPQAAVSLVTGGSFTLNVVATGDDPLTYQWYRNGVALQGATGSSYAITNAGSGAAGSYTVRVTDANGDTALSNPSVVTIQAAPVQQLPYFWGWTNNITDINTEFDVINILQKTGQMTATQEGVPVDVRSDILVTAPKIIHYAEPIEATPKLFWWANAQSNGDVGGPEGLFGIRIIGNYRVYSTVYQTAQPANILYMLINPGPFPA